MSCRVGSGMVRWGRIESCGVLSWHASPCCNLFVLVVQSCNALLALLYLTLSCLVLPSSVGEPQIAFVLRESLRELHSRRSKVIWFRLLSSIATWCRPAVWCGLLPFDVVWCLEWSGVVWCFVGVVCSFVCLVSSGIVRSRLVSSTAVCGRMLSCVVC